MRMMLVADMLERQQFAALIQDVKRHRLNQGALDEALRRFGVAELSRLLMLSLGQPLNTTILHTIFTTGQQCAMDWVVSRMPSSLLCAPEPRSKSTPLHLVAQRPPKDEELANQFLTRLFGVTTLEQMTMCDSVGYNAAHYLASFGHLQAYKAVAARFPHVCTLQAHDGRSAVSCAVDRLAFELETERTTNVALRERRNVEHTNAGRFAHLQAEIVAREQRIAEQQRTIDKLTHQRAALAGSEQKLAKEIGQCEEELDQQRTSCRTAMLDASKARSALADVQLDCEASKQRCAEAEREHKRLQSQLEQKAADVTRIDSAKQRLEKKLRQLRSTTEELRRLDTNGKGGSGGGGDGGGSGSGGSSVTTEDSTESGSRAPQTRLHELEIQIGAMTAQIETSVRERAQALVGQQMLEQARDHAFSQLKDKTRDHGILTTRITDAESRVRSLERQLEERNEKFRAIESDASQLRAEIAAGRQRQETMDLQSKREHAELQVERESLVAQLTDARTAQRRADEQARLEIERTRDDMQQLRQAVALAQQRATDLQREANTTRANASVEVERMRSITTTQITALRATVEQRLVETEHSATSASKIDGQDSLAAVQLTEKLMNGAVEKEAELRKKVSEVEERYKKEINARVHLATVSDVHCYELRDRLADKERKMGDLQKAAKESAKMAKEWEQYTKDVQIRCDKSITELEAQLHNTADLLRSAHKELAQERALSASGTRSSLACRGTTSNKLTATALLHRTMLNLKRAAAAATVTAAVANADGVAASVAAQSINLMAEAGEDGSLILLLRNNELNEKFYREVFLLVRQGDAKQLAVLFTFGLSPNTRNIYHPGVGQTMLEFLVRCAAEARVTPEGDGAKLTLERLTQTATLIVQRGGDWDGLDHYLAANSHLLPEKFLGVLKQRDDTAPFCKALLENRSQEAELQLASIENLNRTPSRYAVEGFTYLHIAVYQEAARLVQAMLFTGNVNVSARDKNDRTPLHLLLDVCRDPPTRLTIAQYLLAAGARPNEPCQNAEIISRTRNHLAINDTSATTNKAARIFRRQSTGVTVTANALANGAHGEQNDARTFGTPIAMARALGDEALVRVMSSRRFLLPTVDETVASESGLPLLQTYIVDVVSLRLSADEMTSRDQMADESELCRIYRRYRDVFFAFNPNFGGSDGYERVHKQIFEAAGIDKYATDESERDVAVRCLVTRDEQELTALLPNGCEFVDLLRRAMTAVAERWFDVSPMIEVPTCDLYPFAVEFAVRHFILLNRALALNYMFNRRDALFGDFDYDAVIDETEQFTAIEFAAHSGAVDVLEWLMERQCTRIDSIGAFGRTLVSIASAAGHSVAIVAIDKYKMTNKIGLAEYPNLAHYGVVTSNNDTVFHQCVLRERPDLLKFCFDLVPQQMRKKNKDGLTPLELADSLCKQQLLLSPLHSNKLLECAQFLRNKTVCAHEQTTGTQTIHGSSEAESVEVATASTSAESAKRAEATEAEATPVKAQPREKRRVVATLNDAFVKENHFSDAGSNDHKSKRRTGKTGKHRRKETVENIE